MRLADVRAYGAAQLAVLDQVDWPALSPMARAELEEMRAGFLALRASLEDEAIAAELAGDGAAGRDLTPAELVGLGVAAVGRSRCLHCRQGLIDERAPVVQRGSILKCGPGALRAGMLQCGWASVRRGGEPVLTEMFERLAPRIDRKRAIVAVTRRLVVRLCALWLEALAEVAVAA